MLLARLNVNTSTRRVINEPHDPSNIYRDNIWYTYVCIYIRKVNTLHVKNAIHVSTITIITTY